MDEIGGKQNKNDRKMKRKGELEEGTGGRVWRESLNQQGAAGKTKRRQDVYSGGTVMFCQFKFRIFSLLFFFHFLLDHVWLAISSFCISSPVGTCVIEVN